MKKESYRFVTINICRRGYRRLVIVAFYAHYFGDSYRLDSIKFEFETSNEPSSQTCISRLRSLKIGEKKTLRRKKRKRSCHVLSELLELRSQSDGRNFDYNRNKNRKAFSPRTGMCSELSEGVLLDTPDSSENNHQHIANEGLILRKLNAWVAQYCHETNRGREH